MLAAIRGEPTDCIPWAPRLDLWYKANRRAGTLPPEHRNSSLVEIVDELGMGLHAVVPDFRDLRGVEDVPGHLQPQVDALPHRPRERRAQRARRG